jgi:hypothetical protein
MPLYCLGLRGGDLHAAFVSIAGDRESSMSVGIMP